MNTMKIINHNKRNTDFHYYFNYCRFWHITLYLVTFLRASKYSLFEIGCIYVARLISPVFAFYCKCVCELSIYISALEILCLTYYKKRNTLNVVL